jgi:hypothetical protein
MPFTKIIQATVAGTETGPFTIYHTSIATGNILLNNVSRSSLLAGVSVSIPDGATLIIVKSTGVCDNSSNVTVAQVDPPPPPPSQEWYQVRNCADQTTTTTQVYPIGTFQVNDRVTNNANTITYTVITVYSVNPGGALIPIVDTGLTGCPTIPPPPKVVQNFGVYVDQANQTECEFKAYIGLSAPATVNTEFGISYRTAMSNANISQAFITIPAGVAYIEVSIMGGAPCNDSVTGSCIEAIYSGETTIDFQQFNNCSTV